MFNLFKKLINKRKEKQSSFQDKFQSFQSLLTDNDEAHKAMSDLAEVIVMGIPFSRGFAQKKLDILLSKTDSMAHQLIVLTGGRYRSLIDRVAEISEKCKTNLIPRITCPDNFTCPNIECKYCDRIDKLFTHTQYHYNLRDIKEYNFLEVGNKMARLGELKNVLGIPVPDGFCLSVRLFEDILKNENIRDKKNQIFFEIDFNNIAQVQYASHQAQALIISTQIPESIEQLILEAFDSTFDNPEIKIAVRSSAFGEDSEKYSFAGLHQSKLNINRENLVDAVMEVLISKYSPQSVIYRYLSGLRDEDMPMSVGCIEMVDAKAGGVLFTKDPNQLKEGIIIQSVWGLGSLVVEGKVKPQEFIVIENGNNLDINFKSGYQDIINTTDSGDKHVKVNVDDYSNPSLTNDEISLLVTYAKQIEGYYNYPLDIEWAVNKEGKVYILQARALKISKKIIRKRKKEISIDEYDKKYKILIDNGECASHGVGSGKVFVVHSVREVSHIPEGSIVVARKNLPEFTSIIHKISALVSEIGSTTGHLSIIARELNVPVLTNCQNASEKLKDGMEVTVIADESRVYEGIIPNLSTEDIIESEKENPYRKSPLYTIWHNVTRFLFKLNLYDPSSTKFNPEFCETIHDVIRFIHEISMKTMFSLYDNTSIDTGRTYQMDFEVPLDLLVIDLGNGLRNDIIGNIITTSDILSKPMLYLIKGMTTPGIKWSGHLSLDTKGFAGIILGNIVDPYRSESVIGSRSYALISDHYLNFFSRLGYHFSRLDAFASDEINNNYINFNFRGGASNIIRKSRRAQAIGRILESMNFSITINEDNVIAKIRKVPEDTIYNLLVEIGKLMGAVRNTDIIMLSDKYVDIFVEAFLSGDPAPAMSLNMNKRDNVI